MPAALTPATSRAHWNPASPGLRFFLLGAAGLAILAFIALWAWGQTAERREIVRLPEQERQAVYMHTLDELKTVCKDGRDSLRSHCRSQARFILQFPECDDACRAVATGHLAQPAR